MRLNLCLIVFASAYWNPTDAGRIATYIRTIPAASYNWLNYLKDGPDLINNTVEMIIRQKFIVETHTITTKDGYIIDLHRLPHQGAASPITTPVLLHHGCFGSSALWVLNTPDQSLGFLLARKGYDVWLSNIRGNKYGRRHTTLDPNKKEFWQFSWDPIALIDLPDIIDYVLKNTSNNKLNLIAHSLGAAQAFALLSTNETYNNKVEHVFALTPEVNFTDVRSFAANVLAKLHPAEMKLLESLNAYEFDVPRLIKERTFGIVPRRLVVYINNFITLSIFGVTWSDMSSERYPLYASHLLSGTSLYVLGQLLQVIKTKRFGRFDWGDKVNEIKYGQSFPPDYDITKVKVGVTLYYARNDNVVSVGSIDYLEKTLPNVTGKYQFGGNHFDHFDFMSSMFAGKDYEKLISTI